jgi:uncharacterized protein Yka (UPF0111/DUF47 family)
MTGSEPAVVEVIQGRTERVLAEVGECIELLSEVVESYAVDEASFVDAVAALGSRESACNEAARDLRVAVRSSVSADAAPSPARDFRSLVVVIDGVANRAERVGTELAAIEPALTDRCHESLRGMAETASRAFEALSDATMAYLGALADGENADPVVEAIERVRKLETECDDLRQATLRMAFEDLATAEALAVRAVAHEMDAVVDAMETAADSMDGMRAAWL